MSDKKLLLLSDILDNPVEELDVPGFGIVKLRCPTVKEKMDARKEAMTVQDYDKLADFDKTVELSRRLAMKILVDPKIPESDYLNSNDAKISVLLDTVAIWYSSKINKLNAQRQILVRDFLDQMKV